MTCLEGPAPSGTLSRDLAAIGRIPYPEQLLVEEMLVRVRDAGDRSVVLVEAPTASGKTHAMASHALDAALSERDGAVVVSAPTIETCRGAMRAIDELIAAVPAYRGLTARLVLGRREFASDSAVADLATAYEEEGQTDLARSAFAWLDAGAPGASPSHPRYTLHGLAHALGPDAPTPPDWVSLDSSGGDGPAQDAYRAQFGDADVVVATHAMLARDLLKRWIGASRLRAKDAPATPRTPGGPGWQERAAEERLAYEADAESLLPRHRRLLVDEAHLLPEGVRAALSSSVSIKEVVAALEALSTAHPRAVPASTLPRIRDARTRLDAIGEERGNQPVRIDWDRARGADLPLREIKAALDAVRIPKTADPAAERTVTRARLALREAIGHPNAVSTTLSWSPSRRYPSFSVTPRDIGSKLAFMWGSLESAALVSATLFVEKVDGPDAGYSRSRLRIPPDALIPTVPIRSSAAADGVELVMVSPDDRALRAPSGGVDDPEWIRALAARVADEAGREARGTLVLCRRAATTAMLSEALAAAGIDHSRVIDGSKAGIVPSRPVFERMSEAGVRPVWVAHGAAWTGLDVHDDLLGTLVIATIPHETPLAGSTSRDEPVFSHDSISAMMMTLKQGVGRLVRSRNPSGKRLVFLDGRIHDGRLNAAAMPIVRRAAGKNAK